MKSTRGLAVLGASVVRRCAPALTGRRHGRDRAPPRLSPSSCTTAPAKCCPGLRPLPARGAPVAPAGSPCPVRDPPSAASALRSADRTLWLPMPIAPGCSVSARLALLRRLLP